MSLTPTVKQPTSRCRQGLDSLPSVSPVIRRPARAQMLVAHRTGVCPWQRASGRRGRPCRAARRCRPRSSGCGLREQRSEREQIGGADELVDHECREGLELVRTERRLLAAVKNGCRDRTATLAEANRAPASQPTVLEGLPEREQADIARIIVQTRAPRSDAGPTPIGPRVWLASTRPRVWRALIEMECGSLQIERRHVSRSRRSHSLVFSQLLPVADLRGCSRSTDDPLEPSAGDVTGSHLKRRI